MDSGIINKKITEDKFKINIVSRDVNFQSKMDSREKIMK